MHETDDRGGQLGCRPTCRVARIAGGWNLTKSNYQAGRRARRATPSRLHYDRPGCREGYDAAATVGGR